jgi:hypothetical protein
VAAGRAPRRLTRALATTSRRARACALGLAAGAALACDRAPSQGPAGDSGRDASAPDPIAALRPFEQETRRAFDFANPPSAETGMGADPWALRRVATGFVGILRGRAAVVLLDDDLNEIARAPAPRSPTGLAVATNGDVLVVGELSAKLARFAVRGRALVPLGELEVPGVVGLRDVAVSPAGVVWALDERGGTLLRVDSAGDKLAIGASIPIGHGAAQVQATARHLVVDAVTDHRLVVIATDARGRPEPSGAARIEHDGPLWGFDARETGDGLVVVAGGVEDHPLDRKGGFFGFIDSFVFAYRVRGGVAARLAAVNVAEHGVITPKALAVEAADGERLTVLVTAYGSATGLRLGLRPDGEPTTAPVPLVPGIRSVERWGAATVMSDPLLDAWVSLDGRGLRVVPVANEPPRPVALRLGEALFFTSLMAPKSSSEGALSRFTCETCHFEGYVDGRTHHTGRADVHATTKPLVGLVGNRPYFSRALDPDLSTVAHAEFRVAGAGNEADPLFTVDPRGDGAWLAHVGVTSPTSALDLRRALMRFLTDFSHRPNPAALGRASFTPLERKGARLFRDRCESCHAARLSADAPATHVPFEQWESFVMRESAPLVWGSAGYQKTGVRPYVHDDGARTPSLRRLAKKHPYFTNGSARSLDEVLAALRFSGATTFHANAPDGAEALDAEALAALRAFLDLL